MPEVGYPDSSVLGLDWSLTGDVHNIYIHQGKRIEVDSKAKADQALAAAERIYKDVGHSMTDEDYNDLANRIRGGQSLEEIARNTFDQAQKRFVVEDTPQSRAEEAAGLRPSYDAQLNTGRAFEPAATYLETVLPARGISQEMNDYRLDGAQGSAPYGAAGNQGPMSAMYGPGGTMMLSSSSGSPWGLILLVGAAAVLGYFLLRKTR